MKKTVLIPLIVFVVLAGGLYMLLTNAHVDIFSGVEKQHDYFTETDKTVSKSVSLLAVSRGDASLDGAGWATATGVIAGIPFLLAFGLNRRLVKKQRKKEAVAGNETAA